MAKEPASLQVPSAHVLKPLAGPSHRLATPSCEPFRGEQWRFGAGAAFAGEPFATAEGSLFFGTNEGYVHALRPTGEYLWSYTLVGAVSGSVVVDPVSQRCVVGTSAGTLDAITAQGSPAWRMHFPAGVSGPVLRGARGYLYFADANRGLYAVAKNGVAIWRVSLAAEITAEPVVWGKEIALGLGRELWLVPVDRKLRTVSLPSAAERLAVFDESLLLVQSSEGMAAVGKGGVEWTRPRATGLAARGGRLAVLEGAQVVWLSRSGQELSRVNLGELGASQLALGSDGAAQVLMPSGKIVTVTEDGRIQTISDTCQTRVLFMASVEVPGAADHDPSRSLLLLGDDSHFLHAFALPPARALAFPQ
ncbi:MAG: PQQ-binding-like beta-propeller repeat protein [Polyangiaceae bacterium]|nr:PQQ-binding-like beta-propeller repeat protein [Polyangiaceae bacterium]